jgi:hypothetical protein
MGFSLKKAAASNAALLDDPHRLIAALHEVKIAMAADGRS